MERCGLLHFRKRLTRNLSGGYQQRLGIAQAIIHRPALVVLDEPTNGLDPNQIMEIRRLVKSIAEEHTVILSTHILSEVQATCHHVRMIEEGRLVFAGTVEEFDNYIIPSSLLVSMIDAPPLDELRRLPGVIDAEALGGIRYRVKFSEEITERLVEASVANGWRLTAIDLERSSLDVIFSALSRGERREQ
jgi:ABC-2 type transport system ATP-binding protein